MAQRLVGQVDRVRPSRVRAGIVALESQVRTEKTSALLSGQAVELTAAAAQRIGTAYSMISVIDSHAQPLKRQLTSFGARQPASRALVTAHYGIGALLAVAVWSEPGDCRRFSRSLQAVRHTGLDVTVDQSDRTRGSGWLSRQRPEMLHWASTRQPRTPRIESLPIVATTNR
jgi:transposase